MAIGNDFAVKVSLDAGVSIAGPTYYLLEKAVNLGHINFIRLLIKMYDWKIYASKILKLMWKSTNKTCLVLVLEQCNLNETVNNYPNQYNGNYRNYGCPMECIFLLDDDHGCICNRGHIIFIVHNIVFKKIQTGLPFHIKYDILLIKPS